MLSHKIKLIFLVAFTLFLTSMVKKTMSFLLENVYRMNLINALKTMKEVIFTLIDLLFMIYKPMKLAETLEQSF